MEKRVVYTSLAPSPVGPYSQAIVAKGEFIFVAGQIPINPETGEIVGEGDIVAQTRQVMRNIGAILKQEGLGWENVVKTGVFLQDLNDFAAMNEVYSQYFPSSPPARSCVQVARLPKDVLVEIECIAVR